MSIINSVIPDCPAVQGSIESAFTHEFGNGVLNEPLPFLQFLASPANANRMQQTMIHSDAKVATMNLTFDHRLPISGVDTGVANPKCTATNEFGKHTEVYTFDVTDNVGENYMFDSADFHYNCEKNGAWLGGQINKLIDVVERKVSSLIAAKAVTHIGEWATDAKNYDGSIASDRLTVQTISGTTPSPFAYRTINMAARKSGYNNQKVIVGGEDLYNHFETSAFAGCCASTGVNLQDAWSRFGVATMWDRDLTSALGGDQYSLITQPGAMQLVWYTSSRWKDGIPQAYVANNYFHGAIESPRSGLPMDLIIKEDCGKIYVNVIATVDLFALPLDYFLQGDVYENVNFVGRIEVV
jgi:hypothetical protein